MKKLTAVILTLCLLMGLIPSAAFAVGDENKSFSSGEVQVVGGPDAYDAEAYAQWKEETYGGGAVLLSGGDDKFSNDYVEVCVHSNGQFTMGTTGGDPNTERDDNKLLLFGHPNSYTSETLIRINGVDYFFQGNAQSNHVGDGVGRNETVRTIAGVQVKQILTPVENPMTGRDDIVKIQYECTNTTSEPKTVGVRIMLDTMLGDNDGAPFRVGEDPVVMEREYSGEAVPRYWLCFDRFDDPSVTSVGTLYTNSAERPDKVQFASWPHIISSPWNYQVSSSRSMYDTAVAAYFNESSVSAGQTKSAVTYYGISETTVQENRPGELAMRIVKPAKLNDAGNGDYENNPFDITAYVKNDGDDPLKNVKIGLDLTAAEGALELAEGETAVKTIDSLESKTADGAENVVAVQWTVQAKPQTEAKTVSYRVTGDYDGQSEQSVVELETELVQLALTHNVTFKADGADVAVLQVAHNGSLAESDAPAVPSKEGYIGNWNPEDLSKLANVTEDITVNADYVPMVQSVEVSPTGVTLTIGVNETADLTPTVLPEGAPDKSVTWSSYNESVATVDPNTGRVTAVAVGTATIEAKSNADPSKSAVCDVKVKVELKGIKVKVDGVEVTDEAPYNDPATWVMTKGDPLDISKLEVLAIYSDNTEVPVSDYTLDGYDPEPEGVGVDTRDRFGRTVKGLEYKDEVLTITYKGDKDDPDAAEYVKNCTVRVKRPPATLTAIHIIRTPEKRLNYVQGEPLNLDGMQVNFAYSDNTMSPEPVTFANGVIPDGFVVTGYDPNRIGNQAITISYGGKSMQYRIRVLPGPNGAAPNNVLQPRLSVESVKGGKLVSLSHPDEYDIYYTTNGAKPNSSSTKYDKDHPIKVTADTTFKAVAISPEGLTSPLTSMKVYVSQVAQPIVANFHHLNYLGPGDSTTELEPGTLVSFISDTAGASIYYWIDGQLGDADNSKYGTSVYMSKDLADKDGNVTICAYAAKDGYKNSDITEMTYHLNIPPVIPEIATISLGSVPGRSGERAAVTLSINSTSNSPQSAMDPNKIRNFSVKVQYNPGDMEFLSVSPLIEGSQVLYANSYDSIEQVGVVTLQYSGVEALDLGEVCDLNFRVQDSTENNDSYGLTLDRNNVSVTLTNASSMRYDFVDGSISVSGAHNSQLTATTTIVNADGDEVPVSDALTAGDDSFMANVTIDLPERVPGSASLSAAGDDMKVLNIFMVIYDSEQAMVSLESWDVDVTDPANLQTVRRIRIPRPVPGGKVRFMIMSENLTPTVAANSLNPRSAQT